MLTRYLSLFLLIFSMIWFSCNHTSNTTSRVQLAPFFDIEDYFNKEIASLASIKSVEKAAATNGKKESKTIQNLDFSKELSIFSQSNINKTSWLDKYEIDSMYNAQQELTQLSYTAKEEQLRTRHIIISFENKAVSKIEIKNTTKNIIAQSEQNLVYFPQKGYSIKSEQDILFSDPREMLVEVAFK